MNSPGDSIDDIISILNKHYFPLPQEGKAIQ